MTDYSKSRIYKIWCDVDGIDEFYVGSTNDFKRRCSEHLCVYDSPNNREHHKKIYEYIRNNGGFENFYIEVLEKYRCKNKTELRKREQEWINELKPTLNARRAFQSVQDKINYNNDLHKKYYRENKTEINKKQAEKINCTNCDKKCRISDITRHKKTKYCINFKNE